MRSERRVQQWLPVFRGSRSADPNGAQRFQQSLPAEISGRCSLVGRAVWHPKRGIDPNLPTGLGYARDQALRSQFAKGETRHLEPANKGAPTPGDFASVHHTGGAGITRQLREAAIIFFRL